MAAQPKHLMTVEEYLTAEETSLDPHEYLNGEVFIAGLWRSNISYQEPVSVDEYHVTNRSSWLDLQVLVRTVPAMLPGARAC